MAYPIFVNDGWVSPEKAHVSVKEIGFLRGYGILIFLESWMGKRFLCRTIWIDFYPQLKKWELSIGTQKLNFPN